MKTGLIHMQDKQEKRGQGPGARGQEVRRSSRSAVPCRLLTRSALLSPVPWRLATRRQAFTLTELLIVIAIMAVLTGLIATAAVNAMRSSRRSSISLDIQNISGAIENFKNDYGAYPPNGMHEDVANPPTANSVDARVH